MAVFTLTARLYRPPQRALHDPQVMDSPPVQGEPSDRTEPINLTSVFSVGRLNETFCSVATQTPNNQRPKNNSCSVPWNFLRTRIDSDQCVPTGLLTHYGYIPAMLKPLIIVIGAALALSVAASDVLPLFAFGLGMIISILIPLTISLVSAKYFRRQRRLPVSPAKLPIFCSNGQPQGKAGQKL